jgi:hypothetical protein
MWCRSGHQQAKVSKVAPVILYPDLGRLLTAIRDFPQSQQMPIIN